MVDQIIRPSALTRRTNPVASEIVPVDNGTSVAGSTLAEIVNAGRPVASRPEAEAGVNAEKSMSPLTTKQSIASEVGVTLASKAQGDRADSAVRTIVEGDGIAVDSSDPQNPKISVTATIPPGGILEPMYGTGSVSTRALADGSVSNEKLADIGQERLLGRAWKDDGPVNELWPAIARAMLSIPDNQALSNIARSALDYRYGGNPSYDYVRLPPIPGFAEGFLIQWGVDSGEKTILFPSPFPRACCFVGGSMRASLNNYVFSFGYTGMSRTGFIASPRFINTSNGSGVPSESYNWLALGY